MFFFFQVEKTPSNNDVDARRNWKTTLLRLATLAGDRTRRLVPAGAGGGDGADGAVSAYHGGRCSTGKDTF